MRSCVLNGILAGLTTSALAAVSPLRITEVNPATGQVEVTNIAVTTETLATNYPFSHSGNTSQFIASGTEFAPGESKTFVLPFLSTTDSDLWLYESATMDASTIVTGLKYGPAANVGDVAVAVAAGIWTSNSAFVPLPGGGNSLHKSAHTFTGPSSWAAASPNFGAYFGTGAAIVDPIPPVQKGTVTISLQLVGGNLTAPLGVVSPDDGTNRLFVYDQGGTISLLVNGAAQSPPFLDVSSRLVPLGLFPPLNYDERGLLGVAFHPNFALNPKIYTHTSEPVSGPADFVPPVSATFDHDNVIAEWTVNPGNPNVIDVSSRREMLRIRHPSFNHDGGAVRFGPDGMLYFTIGDGGGADDQGNGHLPTGNAQDLGNIYGKVLRIDPGGNNSANGQYGIPSDNPFVPVTGAVKEIYAYGLRNPYAFSFDSQTGQLFLGDAGQNKVEEIDLVTSGGNYGWRHKEGSFYFDPKGASPGVVSPIPAEPVPAGLVDPLVEYDHDSSSTVVVGGFVYRATGIPALAGRYICGEFGNFVAQTGRLFYIDAANTLKELRIDTSDRPLNQWVKGFGSDQQGNVYVCTSRVLGPFGTTGAVWRIIAPTAANDWELFE